MLTPPIKKGFAVRMHHRDRLELQNDLTITPDSTTKTRNPVSTPRLKRGERSNDDLRLILVVGLDGLECSLVACSLVLGNMLDLDGVGECGKHRWLVVDHCKPTGLLFYERSHK